MAIQETTANLSAALSGLPLAERALLSALVERMSDLRDEDLSLGGRRAGVRRPDLQLSPIETDYRSGPETEDKAGPETEDKAGPETEDKAGPETDD